MPLVSGVRLWKSFSYSEVGVSLNWKYSNCGEARGRVSCRLAEDRERERGRGGTHLGAGHGLPALGREVLDDLLEDGPRVGVHALLGLWVEEGAQEERDRRRGVGAAVRLEVDARDEVAVAVGEVGNGQLGLVRLVVKVPAVHDRAEAEACAGRGMPGQPHGARGARAQDGREEERTVLCGREELVLGHDLAAQDAVNVDDCRERAGQRSKRLGVEGRRVSEDALATWTRSSSLRRSGRVSRVTVAVMVAVGRVGEAMGTRSAACGRRKGEVSSNLAVPTRDCSCCSIARWSCR